ncbi:MAG: helix-turn-helix domain-containing protein [Lacisediminihabitans sp.]
MALRGEIKNAETLGYMLQQSRLLRGKTQRQLAEELGVSQKYIWEMESGKPTIFTERLFDMMRATGMRLRAEIDDDEEAADHG